MDTKNISNETCPIARTLNFIGDAWSMLILRDAHAGLTRFDQFRKSLGIAPTMLRAIGQVFLSILVLSILFR